MEDPPLFGCGWVGAHVCVFVCINVCVPRHSCLSNGVVELWSDMLKHCWVFRNWRRSFSARRRSRRSFTGPASRGRGRRPTCPTSTAPALPVYAARTAPAPCPRATPQSSRSPQTESSSWHGADPSDGHTSFLPSCGSCRVGPGLEIIIIIRLCSTALSNCLDVYGVDFVVLTWMYI